MTTDADRPEAFVVPRPGVARTLGIFNLLFSSALCFATASMLVYTFAVGFPQATAGVTPTSVSIGLSTGPTAGTTTTTVNLFGADNPRFFWFTVVDSVTALMLNALMFVSGIGLVNLKRWGARLWTGVAWVKIVRLFLFWGYFIVAVTPSLSEEMGRGLAQSPGLSRSGNPMVADLTRIYAAFNLIMAVSVILLGSIYPAISLWMIGRPGVRAVLEPKPTERIDLP